MKSYTKMKLSEFLEMADSLLDLRLRRGELETFMFIRWLEIAAQNHVDEFSSEGA